MRDSRDIVVRPVISEKSYDLAAKGHYTFEVAPTANKIEVRRAIEELFHVNVTAVNTLWVRGKTRRLGRMPAGKTRSWKKAVVTLASGQSIELFETG
jgi:large subunit ribosomal protein L23